MRTLIFTVVILLTACSVNAAVTTYFGEDLGLGEGTKLSSWAYSDAASAAFQSRLVGVGTESFESQDGAMNGKTLSFGAAGNATFVGTMSVATQASGTNGFGRYPTDGVNYLEGSTSSFAINFSKTQAAFGFYGIDIGDFDGRVTLTKAGGITETYDIAHTVGGMGGSVLFFGVIGEEAADGFISITISNSNPYGYYADYFGFDEMTIGTLRQVVPPPPGAIPAPGAFLLGTIGVSCVGWLRRRKSI